MNPQCGNPQCSLCGASGPGHSDLRAYYTGGYISPGSMTWRVNTAELQTTPEPPKLDVPEASGTEVISAYREWRLGLRWPDGPLLLAAVQKTPWTPRKRMEAVCLNDNDYAFIRNEDPKPKPFHTDRRCSCGIYARKDGVMAALDAQSVVGTVALWGQVIEHANGYRAEFAYPTRLAVVGYSQAIAEALGWVYGVPCEVFPA